MKILIRGIIWLVFLIVTYELTRWYKQHCKEELYHACTFVIEQKWERRLKITTWINNWCIPIFIILLIFT